MNIRIDFNILNSKNFFNYNFIFTMVVIPIHFFFTISGNKTELIFHFYRYLNMFHKWFVHLSDLTIFFFFFLQDRLIHLGPLFNFIMDINIFFIFNTFQYFWFFKDIYINFNTFLFFFIIKNRKDNYTFSVIKVTCLYQGNLFLHWKPYHFYQKKWNHLAY